jgi:hypothetical protein
MINVTYGYTEHFMFFDVWHIDPLTLVYSHHNGRILDTYNGKTTIIMQMIDKGFHNLAYYLLLNY